MNNEAQNQAAAQDANRPSGNVVKRLVIFLWHGIGRPGAWLLLMVYTAADGAINGQDILNNYWMGLFLLAYLLSRIVVAIEALNPAGN